jgi:hypothetical protein
VDWEAAFLNDRYADLAAAANMVVTNPEEEAAFLHEYFGAPPDRYQLARFHLMRQLAHLFYTMAFLFQGAMGQAVDCGEPVPAYGELQRRLWAGEADLSDKAVKVAYGRASWQLLQQNARLPRYQEALQIVSMR